MILNRQRHIRVPIKELDRFLMQAMELLRLPKGCLTVCLVNNSQMARWNETYRGKDRPTDVLSFSSNENGQGTSGEKKQRAERGGRGREAHAAATAASNFVYLGDLAIAPLVARDNALRFGRSFEDEMRILILHGILHLMGYDHETDNGQMARRERRLRRTLGLV